MNNSIPIFYACDDNFAELAVVSLTSMLENADQTRQYHIYFLNTGLSDAHRQALLSMQAANVTVSFPDVTEQLEAIREKLPTRDYFTSTTYYRLFIPELFPQYDKAVYLDSDTVVVGDISQLYDHDLKDNYLGAVKDQVIIQEKVFGDYAETVLGIDRNAYFSAGILLLNCRAFREKQLLGRFVNLLNTYNFVVAQDQDYLNVLCKDRVLWLEPGWNTQIFGKIICPEEEMKIVHYIMASKPWHCRDCRLKGYFWQYAEKTSVYEDICRELENYTDEQRQRDAAGGERLVQTALAEISRPDHYMARVRMAQAPDRVAVVEKIDELERLGIFDMDVEQDPPTKVLTPDQIEYVRKSLSATIKTQTAFYAAKKFVKYLLKNNQLIIKDIVGVENFANLDSGAIITCNHFNAFDSFAIHLAYMASGHKARRFYRVIREGNYTNFPGFYGFLMRNCDTLPLSSNPNTMKKFVRAVNELLQAGHFILFYPEQSMWWNYRKPKPLKDSAFSFAARNMVPVLPCFITMKDSGILGPDGFFVQEYTVHVGTPIYPREGLTARKNAEQMKAENFEQWKAIYEGEYGIPLQYKTENAEAI
ncbi:MAG: glycosyltransferase [Eubacteriales bacterium]|nr:glycosyltransferase [Eubacteriales bacterium]